MPEQDVAVELFYDGAWHDLAAAGEVFADDIVIKRGQSDEGSAFRPCSITCSLDNRTDTFRTSNPLSPLYGKAGRNTPLRVSVGGTVRGIAEASSWTADQEAFQASPPLGRAWVDVEAGGVLQRIGQWTQTLRSALHQYDDDNLTSVVGRWPLEDPKGTTSPESLAPGSGVVNATQVAFDSQFKGPGTGPLADIGGPNGGLAFTFASPASSTAWQFSTIERLPNLDSGALPFLFDLTLADTTDIIVTFDRDNGIISILVQTNTGTQLFYGEAVIGQDLTPMTMWVVQFTQSGGNISVALKWRAPGDPAWGTITGSYAGTVSPLKRGAFFGGDLPEGTTIGHLVGLGSNTPDLSSDDRWDAYNGHLGERTSYRFGRLCDQLGIGYYVSASFDDSSPMGAQPVASLPDQLKEIVDTEDALLYDHRTELKLFLLTRADRYNQTPVLDLAPTDLPDLPAEVSDDLYTHNIVTASQRDDGSEATAEDLTSPLSSQPPPDGVGEARQTVNVNVAVPATDLPQEANWWMRRGTVDLPRFPTVTIDLNARPDLIADVEAVDIGNVITITGMREYVVRLIVIGSTETIGTHSRTIAFTCVPDQQFQTGVLNSNRLGAYSTTLNAGITSSATSLTLKMTDVNEQWRTGNNAVPVSIGGELITLGTVGARSGTGPWTQAVTGCTRAVNGIAKAHSAGDGVTVVGAIRLGLKGVSA